VLKGTGDPRGARLLVGSWCESRRTRDGEEGSGVSRPPRRRHLRRELITLGGATGAAKITRWRLRPHDLAPLSHWIRSTPSSTINAVRPTSGTRRARLESARPAAQPYTLGASTWRRRLHRHGPGVHLSVDDSDIALTDRPSRLRVGRYPSCRTTITSSGASRTVAISNATGTPPRGRPSTTGFPFAEYSFFCCSAGAPACDRRRPDLRTSPCAPREEIVAVNLGAPSNAFEVVGRAVPEEVRLGGTHQEAALFRRAAPVSCGWSRRAWTPRNVERGLPGVHIAARSRMRLPPFGERRRRTPSYLRAVLAGDKCISLVDADESQRSKP